MADGDASATSWSQGVCNFCRRDVLSSESDWGFHHGSHESLRRSAEEHCIFCHSLFDEIQSRLPDSSVIQWPTHRWSIHKPARMREQAEVFNIIFRPLYHSDSMDDKTEPGDLLTEKSFYFYHTSDLGHVPLPQDLGGSTQSTQSWEQVNKWFHTCLNSHPKCRRKADGPPELPTRLLDISDIDAEKGENQPGSARVVDTKAQNIEGPYMTLSHSWGPKPKFIIINRQNLDQMTTVGFKLNHPELSNNFREAILVARKLGINYIWMDSICILQGGDGDFHTEAHKMDIYYRNSHCNIAAANSKRPEQGLFRKRDRLGRTTPIIPARFQSSPNNAIFGDSVSWVIIPVDFWESQLLLEPLYKRGWVFQERMLAPRIIHYAQDQIFFECATISACEMIPDKLPREVDIRAASDRHWRERLQSSESLKDHPQAGSADLSIDSFWKLAVSTYTRCDLTNGKDRLVAISGVQNLVAQALGETFGHGLWRNELEEQLAWRVVEFSQAESQTPTAKNKPVGCPSWSWASCDAALELRDRLSPARDYRVTNHDGDPIRFVVTNTERDEVDVPKSLLEAKDGTVLPTSPIKAGTLFSPKEPDALLPLAQNEVKDHMPVTDHIEIRGYVRKGEVFYSEILGNWMLRACAEQQPDRTDEDRAICRAILDVQPTKDVVECHFLVLAYSRVEPSVVGGDDMVEVRNDEGKQAPDGSIPPTLLKRRSSLLQNKLLATFQGIGLILRKASADRFYRVGAFTFEGLSEETMSKMVVIDKSSNADELSRDIYLH